ncbi:SBBP repeat-containing protein [Myxococcaceae bacterium GXIMD 01537]
MRFARNIRKTVLTGAMALLAIPGCQVEEPAAEAAPSAPSAESAQELGCYMNLVPAMTSATTPGGVVDSSGAYSSDYEAWKAFDGSPTSMWISPSGQTPAVLSYRLPEGARRVTKYALRYSNGSITTRAPKSWELWAWNDTSTTPVLIDSRTNETGWAGHERREYTLATPGSYRNFSLTFTDDNDPASGIVAISLGNVEIIGCTAGGTPFWTQSVGVAGEFTQVNDIVAAPTPWGYATGMTTASLGGPLVGAMDAFLNAYLPGGGLYWSKQLGVPGNVTVGQGVMLTRSSDDLYVGGFAGGSLDGAPALGTRDAFVSKYTVEGVWQWTRQMGAAGAETEGYAVAVDAADSAFLVGYTNGHLDGNTRIGRYDAFVTKYDSAGNKQWTRTVGSAGADTLGRRASADDAGNIYISGWTSGALDGNVKVGTYDFFITKYNAAGVKQWTRQLGAPSAQTHLYGSALDASGNIYVTGYSHGGIDGNPSGAGLEMFLAKYDASGAKQWVRQLSTLHGSWGVGVAIHAGAVYVGGNGSGDLLNPSSVDGAPHTFVAKYDLDGNFQTLYQQAPAMLNGVEQYSAAQGFSMDGSAYAYLGGFTEGKLYTAPLKGNPGGFVLNVRTP